MNYSNQIVAAGANREYKDRLFKKTANRCMIMSDTFRGLRKTRNRE